MVRASPFGTLSKAAALGLAAVAVLLQSACIPQVGRCAEAERFFAEYGYGIEEFAGLDPDSQYEIYICGVQARHPPHSYLASAYAEEGEPAARYLEVKLSHSPNDRTTEDIILVLREMEAGGHYSVRTDEALMALARVKVEAMRPGMSQSQTRSWLREIERGGFIQK
jgi:hypothetical protein